MLGCENTYIYYHGYWPCWPVQVVSLTAPLKHSTHQPSPATTFPPASGFLATGCMYENVTTDCVLDR